MIKKPEAAEVSKAPKKRVFPRPQPVLALAFALLLLVSVCYVGVMPETVAVTSAKRELPVYCVARDDNVISISFDASWGGDKTMKLLDILDQYEIKTTFFSLTSGCRNFPSLFRKSPRAGTRSATTAPATRTCPN